MTIRGTFSARSGTERATILVVDDEEAIRRMMEKMLWNSGYTVLNASSAVEALSVCQERSTDVDLVVTDIAMPGMSGFDLAQRISERWPSIRILFMSGCANDLSVRRQLYERPLLPKPFTRDELASKVRELLTPAPSNG